MAALVTYVRDIDTDAPLFAVVADKAKAEYVWPKGVEPWFTLEQRLPFIMFPSEDDPTDPEGWIALATRHTGESNQADVPFEANNLAQAKSMAAAYLKASSAGEQRAERSPALVNVEESFYQVSSDYPGFGDSDESLVQDTQAVDNLVLMALGPIDPEGPNGWILRAQDGNPRPGDETEFVHFPGTIEATGADKSEEDSQ